jgi:hypothetical protein
MWTSARLTAYIASAIGGSASLFVMMGLATYDAATGMVDIHPFNITLVAGIVAGPISSALAFIALKFGWGKK